MFRSVMVPLDGSSLAERAIEFAVPIAIASGAELYLATVRRSIPDPDAHKDVEQLYIERTAGIVSHRLGRPVKPVLLVDIVAGRAMGSPPRRAVADVLEDYVRQLPIDLTIMTTHGRGGLSRVYMGSVADAFMRYSPAPVLIFKPVEKPPAITHILVLLDGTAEAQAIVPSVVALAKATAATCTLLRVIPHGCDPYNATIELRHICDTFEDSGVEALVDVRMSANPAAAIIVYAVANGADVLALTTRTRNPMQRMFLGSVAETLVRKGGRPVLICNPFGQTVQSGQVEAAEVADGR